MTDVQPPEPTPADHARTASDAIRAINHLTLGADAFAEPADLYATVAALAEMLERLPQALTQLGKAVDRLDAGAMYDDRGGHRDPGVTAHWAVLAITAANGPVVTMATAARSAAESLSHLGLRDA